MINPKLKVDFEILHQDNQHNSIEILKLESHPFAKGSESYIYNAEFYSSKDQKKTNAIIKLMKNNMDPEQLMEAAKNEYGTMLSLRKKSYQFIPELFAGLNCFTPVQGPAILMKKYGPDLSSIAGKIEDANFFLLARNIINAVTQLHKLGYVHRDLKPENIIYHNQDKQSIKLIDFRATRLIGTPSKEAAGNPSPIYWIPQYSWVDGTVDPQEDIFSLGLSLFYVKHGFFLQEYIFPPEQWKDFQTEALMLLHYEKRFLDKRKFLEKTFPDEIDQILLRLANPKPSERPSLMNVIEFIDNIISKQD